MMIATKRRGGGETCSSLFIVRFITFNPFPFVSKISQEGKIAREQLRLVKVKRKR